MIMRKSMVVVLVAAMIVPTTSKGDQVKDCEEIVNEQTAIIKGKDQQLDLRESQNNYLKSALDSTFQVIKKEQESDNAWYNDKFLYLFVGAVAGGVVMRNSK